ncbi:hypothetical protein S40293_10378 [Stachybotrys chartarum IBT 40293]|nr:hypothetical protein S40293_10378 [Stachybotrys chartarum IBT 40293]
MQEMETSAYRKQKETHHNAELVHVECAPLIKSDVSGIAIYKVQHGTATSKRMVKAQSMSNPASRRAWPLIKLQRLRGNEVEAELNWGDSTADSEVWG